MPGAELGASHSEAATEEELIALETGALDPSAFPHPEHVRFAYGMLERYPFSEAIARFSRGLKLLAAKAGRPEIYHETITVAFLGSSGNGRRTRGVKIGPTSKRTIATFSISVAWKNGTEPSSSAPISRVRRFVCPKERRFPNHRLNGRRFGNRRSLKRNRRS
ncbi:MAG: hypothetical protein QOJ45_2527 [Verrucomicrobiota bacterium]|jgi:hypothetical protein